MKKLLRVKYKAFLLGLLALVGFVGVVYAQSDVIEVRGTKIPKFNKEGRLVYQIFAGYARIKGSAPVMIREMRVEYYKKNGDVEMTMESPKCLYDRAKSAADSEDDVKIVRDGMTVTGRGFEWEGTNEVFKIFNNAKVVIRGKSATDQLGSDGSTKE